MTEPVVPNVTYSSRAAVVSDVQKIWVVVRPFWHEKSNSQSCRSFSPATSHRVAPSTAALMWRLSVSIMALVGCRVSQFHDLVRLG